MIEVLNSLEELDDVKKFLQILAKILNNENYRNRSWFEWAIAILENNKVLHIFDIPVMSEEKK